MEENRGKRDSLDGGDNGDKRGDTPPRPFHSGGGFISSWAL